MKLIAIVSVFAFLIGCDSQNKTANKTVQEQEFVGKPITIVDFVSPSDVKQMVAVLASDAMNGRDTGTKEINDAANYIETQFKAYGLKPYFNTYRDNFNIDALKAFNVVGYLEGTDSNLKNEFVIIGAHYDHIGTMAAVNGDTIANGANDNAAGTSGVLALAKYFGEKKSNKRSLLFVTFTAEEKGLLGSKHLAKRLKKDNINLYTLLNLEMIGVPFVGRDYEAFITGHELSNLAQKMNSYAGEQFIGASSVSKKYGLFKRSDNYPFYEAFKAPCHTISSCDLTNFDFYHHVDDEVDKLDYNFMSKLINKLGPVIEQIANTSTKEIKMNGK